MGRSTSVTVLFGSHHTAHKSHTVLRIFFRKHIVNRAALTLRTAGTVRKV